LVSVEYSGEKGCGCLGGPDNRGAHV
jgi:hypothetical protein